MKVIFTLILLLTQGLASAQTLSAGDFAGKTNQGDDVELFLRDYPGRDGSFIAILVKEKKIGFPYLIDKFSPNKYGMVPLKALPNGVIGLEDAEPSLSLTVVKEGKKNIINILSNNSSNKLGFNEGMRIKFKEKCCTKLVSTMNGTFKGGGKINTTLSSQDGSHEAALNLSLPQISGSFVLRESRPFLHILLNNSLTTTGTKVSEDSNHMAFFVEGTCLFGDENMVLMESGSGKLTYLKQK